MNRFAELIGQDDVKKKLNFYLDAHEKTKRFPFLLLTGAKGMGKTEFAKETARGIKAADGAPKAFLEINCGTIKNAQVFFEQVLPLSFKATRSRCCSTSAMRSPRT